MCGDLGSNLYSGHGDGDGDGARQLVNRVNMVNPRTSYSYELNEGLLCDRRIWIIIII